MLILTYIVNGTMNIAWPYLTGTVLFDRVLGMDDTYLAKFGLAGKFGVALLVVALTMLLVRFLQALSNYLQIFVMAKLSSTAIRDLKNDAFDAMSRLSLNFFTSKQTGGLRTYDESLK